MRPNHLVSSGGSEDSCLHSIRNHLVDKCRILQDKLFRTLEMIRFHVLLYCVVGENRRGSTANFLVVIQAILAAVRLWTVHTGKGFLFLVSCMLVDVVDCSRIKH